jgi:hypothetical protein
MRESEDERDSGSENQMMRETAVRETADQRIKGRESRGIEAGEREEAQIEERGSTSPLYLRFCSLFFKQTADREALANGVNPNLFASAVFLMFLEIPFLDGQEALSPIFLTVR